MIGSAESLLFGVHTMRLISLNVTLMAIAVAGCTATGALQSGISGLQSKPNIVLVSDFTVASEIVVIDRGYTARLERKVGAYPTHERRQRTTDRVNDEIVATIIVTLREGGLDARNGSEDTLTLDQNAFVVTGNLRPSEPVTEKNKNSIGFGSGRGHVVASVSGSLYSAGGKHDLLTFNVESAGGKREAPVSAKVAAARNAAIASVVAANGGPAERLSPDVEAPARRLGRAIGERLLGYAKEQGWLEQPAVAEARPKAAEPAPQALSKPRSDDAPETTEASPD